MQGVEPVSLTKLNTLPGLARRCFTPLNARERLGGFTPRLV